MAVVSFTITIKYMLINEQQIKKVLINDYWR